MISKLPLLLLAALLSGCALFEEDQPRAGTAAGVDEQPSPALTAVLAQSQGLPQDQVNQAPEVRQTPAQVRRGVRGRGRVARARLRRRTDAPSAEVSPQ